MKLLKPAFLYFFALIIIIGSSCSSGKSAYERGNYYDAVMTAANRLCRNPGHRKSSKTLCAAYPLALKYHDERVSIAITSNVEFKWREVVQQYTLLQSMYDQIQRCPGSSAVISKPISYQVKLADARQKAAEESYNAGIITLGMGDRTNAKKAYYLFINTNDFVPGYKDVSKRIEQALALATIKVAVEPIPVIAKNYALDAHYFDSKLNEYLVSNQPNEFVKYYKMADAKSQQINPDHIVQLTFEEFSIGQIYVNEKESQVERDSVVVAYAFTDTKGNQQQKETDSPKIIPVAGGGTGTASGNNNESGKTDEKEITETKSTDVSQGKTEEKKPEDKNVTDPEKNVKSNEPKPADDKKNDDKSGDEKKTDNNAVGGGVGVGVTDKKDEKPDEKTSDDKKSEDMDKDGDKKDEKSDKPADSNSGGSGKEDKNDEKKDDGNSEEKVTICHQPPGKPSERKTLTVPQSAVKAHLAHGDIMGECKSEKKDDKGKDKGKDGGEGMASLLSVDHGTPVMIASVSNERMWYLFNEASVAVDTTKVFGKVKATVRQYKKTITSRGVLNFRILDAKTRAVISEQRMPSETVWVSEWLTYNGDSRALTPEQVNLAKRKELPPPSNQDLFAEFSKPLFDQITSKLVEFYKNY